METICTPEPGFISKPLSPEEIAEARENIQMIDQAHARLAARLQNPPIPKPGQTQHEANLEYHDPR